MVYLETDTLTIWHYGVPITIEASAQFINQLYGNYPFYPIDHEHPSLVWLNIVTNAPEALISEVDSIIASLTFRRCTMTPVNHQNEGITPFKPFI
jgi:hypothetical protein